MSLTSYRAAPPRGECIKQNSGLCGAAGSCFIFDCEDLLWIVFCRPGGDLLSRVLRQSTIGAEAFDGRVRDGIGSGHFARATRPAKDIKFLKQEWFFEVIHLLGWTLINESDQA